MFEADSAEQFAVIIIFSISDLIKPGKQLLSALVTLVTLVTLVVAGEFNFEVRHFPYAA